MAGYIGSKASVVNSGAERKKVFDITTTTTSLTGCSYTPNQVHVYHNGVRLVDGTDYTATDGSTVTLTTAAQSGDEVVVISYATFQTSDTVSASAGGTFTGDVTFGGAFTSQGIDDNATATAMTLDTSGNLLVGKTSTSLNVDGTLLSADGSLFVTKNNSRPVIFNRRTSDGNILDFQKDGSTVGSIGATGGRAFIAANNGSSGGGIRFDSASCHPTDKDGVISDNSLDLGKSSYRFKDLYLSGGVYLGGTGAANKLDDYEEGTWTPAPGTGTWTVNQADYTKIGRVVICTFFVTATSTVGSNDFTGLPFTPNKEAGGIVGYQNSTSGVMSIYIQAANVWNFRQGSTQVGLANTASARGTLTYTTDA